MGSTPGVEVKAPCHLDESTPPVFSILHLSQLHLHSFLIPCLEVGPGDTLVGGVVPVQHGGASHQYCEAIGVDEQGIQTLPQAQALPVGDRQVLVDTSLAGRDHHSFGGGTAVADHFGASILRNLSREESQGSIISLTNHKLVNKEEVLLATWFIEELLLAT